MCCIIFWWVTKFHTHTKQQAKSQLFTSQYLYLIKCTCGIMSCYRRFHSSVCPDDCHSQRTSLCVKFWQSCPQFAEQVFITVNHHYNRPPTSVNLLWMLALRLFVKAPHQNTTRLLRWNSAGQLSLPTGSPLARPATRITLSTVYVYVGFWLAAADRKTRPWPGVTDKVHISATQLVSQTKSIFARHSPKCSSTSTLNVPQ